LFDFALHMPAIAMWVARSAGVLFHTGAGPRSLGRPARFLRTGHRSGQIGCIRLLPDR
jgi:hypothetical protein